MVFIYLFNLFIILFIYIFIYLLSLLLLLLSFFFLMGGGGGGGGGVLSWNLALFHCVSQQLLTRIKNRYNNRKPWLSDVAAGI